MFPQLVGVSVERVFAVGKSVRIQVRAGCAGAACPACGGWSERVHSRYERGLADVAAGGQERLVHLQVRRFFCCSDGCAAVTFAEQVPALAGRRALRTAGLTETLEAIALVLGGRAGARLTGRLASSASRSTLLRLVRALPATAPRLLGVDLSRSCDYPDCWRGRGGMRWWRACAMRPGAGQVGIITGFPGRREVCRAGGSGRA
ncbi:MAG TPA: transposase family protein [Streptosporangiaceae bacterium]|nr:transposase family protein [Streptosporangiaceae bacterium]